MGHVPARPPLLALLVVVVAPVLPACGGGDGGGGASPDRPNVIVIQTDDQAAESMRVMKETERLLGDQGVTFAANYATYPLCCPSRATLLTGQYAHNHGVIDNIPPEGGFYRLDSNETLPVWLHRAGYRTIHVGKYLNRYGKDGKPTVPPGWDHWFTTIDPSTYQYFGFEVSVDGERSTFNATERNYQTDVLTTAAQRSLAEALDDDRPFFLAFDVLAPHAIGQLGEAIAAAAPAPRHRGEFADEPLPDKPSYDEEDVGDKPEFIADLDPIKKRERRLILTAYRRGLESLLAVDEAVAKIVGQVEDAGALDETLIIFTSDNGYFHGEHRIRTQKTFLYEEAARVPLLIRGPGFPKGKTVRSATGNVDLAATILAATGAHPGLVLDGLDLATVVADPERFADRAVLLENANNGPRPQSQGVVTARWAFVEHNSGEAELYDLDGDPYQLENVAGKRAYGLNRLELFERLDRLRTCAGETCIDLEP